MLGLTPYVPTVGHALSWGVTASGVVQLGLLMWAVRRAGMGLRLPWPRMTPQMRLLMRRMAPGLVGAGVTQLNLAVDVIIASLLPAGTVSVLYYADRVQQLPLGVIGTAVGTALLPLLSRQVRAGEGAAAHSTLNRAIEYALFLTLPAALALIVAAWPIMFVLFGRGAFGAESAHLFRAGARGLCRWIARLRAGEGACARFFRARRHGDAGEDRACRRGAESRAERRLHGAAAADGAGAGHQPRRDLQHGRPCRGAGAARASAAGRAALRPRLPRMLGAAAAMGGGALAGVQHVLFARARPAWRRQASGAVRC